MNASAIFRVDAVRRYRERRQAAPALTVVPARMVRRLWGCVLGMVIVSVGLASRWPIGFAASVDRPPRIAAGRDGVGDLVVRVSKGSARRMPPGTHVAIRLAGDERVLDGIVVGYAKALSANSVAVTSGDVFVTLRLRSPLSGSELASLPRSLRLQPTETAGRRPARAHE